MLHGWIKLHRKLLDHWSASEPEMLATWIRLLLEANHQDSKKLFNGSLVEIKRGQLIFGYNAFSTKAGVSKKKLERYMKLFEGEGMLERQRGSKYSLLTITCYDSYQERGGKGEAEGRQKGSKGEHRKNVKNENNGEKHSSKAKTSNPSEVQAYFEDRGYYEKGIGEKFINYYDSIGWMRGKQPVKDWKATARTWMTKIPKATKPTVQPVFDEEAARQREIEEIRKSFQ